jgi:hypothetical protein
MMTNVEAHALWAWALERREEAIGEWNATAPSFTSTS